jgi:hypothetical protein
VRLQSLSAVATANAECTRRQRADLPGGLLVPIFLAVPSSNPGAPTEGVREVCRQNMPCAALTPPRADVLVAARRCAGSSVLWLLSARRPAR